MIRLNSRHIGRLSNKAFFLFSPVSVFAYPLTALVNKSNINFVFTLIIGLVITLVTFIFYFAAQKLMGKYFVNMGLLSSFFSILIIAFTGMFRGIIFYSVSKFLSIDQFSSMYQRITSSTLTTMFWLGLTNLIVNISMEFQKEYQAILNHYLLQKFAEAPKEPLNQRGLDELNRFQTNLAQNIGKVPNFDNREELRRISAELTFQINENLKPLSRRIWLRSLTEYPVIDFRKLLRDSFRHLEFSMTKFVVIMTTLAQLENLFIRSLYESSIRTLSYMVSAIIIIYIHKSFFRVSNELGNLIFLVVLGFLPVFVSEYLIWLLGYESNVVASLLVIPLAPALVMVLSVLQLTKKDREYLLNLLAQSASEIDRDSDLNLGSYHRNLASYLHNSVQSELLSLSHQLAAASMTDDIAESKRVIKKLTSVVNRSWSADFMEIDGDIYKRFSRLEDSWKNILSIQISIDNELLISHPRPQAIIQSIEEVVSNCYRHGQATEVRVSGYKGEVGLLLKFQSNSSKPLTKSKGLGESWLTQTSLKPWSIVQNSEGTLIEIEV